MKKELEKTYNPTDIEERTYEKWLEKKYFHAQVNRDKKPFTIVMPPPNITGQLHMGHALDNALQDIIIRMKRMQGYEALWLPGTDHASIATEAKVVEKLKEEGLTKEDLGREKFLDIGKPLPIIRIRTATIFYRRHGCAVIQKGSAGVIIHPIPLKFSFITRKRIHFWSVEFMRVMLLTVIFQSI